MARRLLKIPFLQKRQKKQRSFRVRLFRFASLSIVLALLMSSFNFLVLKDQPEASATTFTSSGTWTVPAGMQSATFEAWGGGGSGAGSGTNGTGGGGGAGGQYTTQILAVNPGDIYTVAVGGTTAGGTSSGTTGQDSSVTSPASVTVVLAKGGAGGTAGGAGGSGSTANGVGTTVFAGGNGGAGSGTSATAGGGGGGAGSTGNGGNASGTTAGTGTSTNGGNGGNGGTGNYTGVTGSNYGGGGSGASKSSGSSKSGGTGAQGLIVITPSTSPITSTIRQEINILDGNLATSSTSSAIVQLDTTKYSGTVSYYFEVVTGSSSASTDSVTLTRKSTSTNDASISLAGTAANIRVRSSAFTPPSSTQTEYVVKTGASHSIKAARIIVIQTQYPISNNESQIEIGNQETGKTNTTAAALTAPKYWKYTAANWDSLATFSAEVTKAQSSSSTAVSVTLQQDNGSFASWTDVATVVSSSTATTATRFRVSFTPTDGRNYRLSASETSGSFNYSIYNAKIIIDQSSAPGWSQTGSSLSISSVLSPRVAGMSSTRVAYIDGSNQQLRAYDFSGTTWSQTGSSLTLGASNTALAALSSTRVAYMDNANQQLRAYDFSGTTWSQTGSSLNVTTTGGIALAGMSSTRIAYFDTSNHQLRAYDFNGSTWSQVGSSLTLTGENGEGLAALSSTRIALADSLTHSLTAYDFNGSTWSQTGNSLTSLSGNTPSLTALSGSRVTRIDSSFGQLCTYDFDGTNWSQSGAPLTISGIANQTGLASLSSTRLAYIDGGNDQMRTYDLSTAYATKLETQYLAQNTVASSTGLQGYPTKWDSAEWNGVSNTYKNVIDSTNASSSAKLQDIDNANTDVTGSTATGNNQIFSSVLTMPASGHQIDANITANATTLTADRIDAQVSITGAIATNSAPNIPTLNAPSSGATGVSTTPTFSFNDTDPDSDDIQFKINLFQSDCSTTVSMTPSGDMASGQTGWATTFNGTAGSGLTYTSSTSGSGVSFTPTTALSAGTTYCWSVSANDPGGSNTTTTSSTQSFTTAASGPTTDQEMRGGTYFSNGTKQPIYWAQ